MGYFVIIGKAPGLVKILSSVAIVLPLNDGPNGQEAKLARLKLLDNTYQVTNNAANPPFGSLKLLFFAAEHRSVSSGGDPTLPGCKLYPRIAR